MLPGERGRMLLMFGFIENAIHPREFADSCHVSVEDANLSPGFLILSDKLQMIFNGLIGVVRRAGIEDDVQADVESVIVNRPSVFLCQRPSRKEIDTRMILQILVARIHERLNIRGRRILQLEEHDMRQFLTCCHGRPF